MEEMTKELKGANAPKPESEDMKSIDVIRSERDEYIRKYQNLVIATQYFRGAYKCLSECYTNAVSDLISLSKNRDMVINPADYQDVDNLTSAYMYEDGMGFMKGEIRYSANGREIIDEFIDKYGEYPVFHDMYSGVGCGVCEDTEHGVSVGVIVTNRELSKLDIDKMSVDLKADKIMVFGKDSVEWKILSDANTMMTSHNGDKYEINDNVAMLTRRISQKILDDNDKNVIVGIVLDSPDDKIAHHITEVINHGGYNDMLWYPRIIGILDSSNNVIVLKQVLSGIQEWLDYRMGGAK